MKKLIAVLPALMLAIAACGTASAHHDAALLTALQDRYKALQSAMSGDDRRRVAAILAPHFVALDVVGQSEGPHQLLGDVDSIPLDRNATITTRISSPLRRGNVVVVARRVTVETADNERFVGFSTDTWIRVSGAWLLRKTQTTKLEFYVDGEQIAGDVRSH